MWSPIVHVDIEHQGTIYAADMGKGKVATFKASEWVTPTASFQIAIPDATASRILQQYVERGYGYGWVDFLLYPFRKFILFDGAGKICSEMVAEILVAMGKAYNAPGTNLAYIAATLEGKEHTMSPSDLFEIVHATAFVEP